MTKEKIKKIVKRYKYVSKAIHANLKEITFYVGNRKEKLRITEDVRVVYGIIEDIQNNISDGWLQKIVRGILQGAKDVSLLCSSPCARNVYYKKKDQFIQTIYACYIAKKMIPYEEILKAGLK